MTATAITQRSYASPGYAERASVNGTELEYKVIGTGEPIVLIHGAVVADAFEPLLAQASLADRYQLIAYHRRGYGASARPTGPVAIPDQAADLRDLLRHLGVERAHIVGHSYGGSVGLQLALDSPEVVQSLTVMEPALLAVPSGAEFGARTVEPAFAAYAAGDKAAALDIFMRGVEGPDYRDHIGPGLPEGAWEQALTDVDTLFQVELPSILHWSFGPEEACRIGQPVLSVAGTETVPAIRESHDVILSWIPQAEPAVIPHATHALQMMNPECVAQAIAAFLANHSLRPETGGSN